jgi:hypothetical protein
VEADEMAKMAPTAVLNFILGLIFGTIGIVDEE